MQRLFLELAFLVGSLLCAAACPPTFRQEAAAILASLQAPADCASARLLVLETEPEHFEGIGSVLVAVAEGLAEAHASARTLVLGPPSAQPSIFRHANLTWASLFQPVGSCTWEEDVTAAEAAHLCEEADSCKARVKMSTPTRGGPMLYAPPPELDVAGSQLSPPAAAACWAAAVFGAVVRLQPEVETRLEGVRAALFGDDAFAAAHLRQGDNALHAEQYGGRVYTNKPEVDPAEVRFILSLPLLRPDNHAGLTSDLSPCRSLAVCWRRKQPRRACPSIWPPTQRTRLRRWHSWHLPCRCPRPWCARCHASARRTARTTWRLPPQCWRERARSSCCPTRR